MYEYSTYSGYYRRSQATRTRKYIIGVGIVSILFLTVWALSGDGVEETVPAPLNEGRKVIEVTSHQEVKAEVPTPAFDWSGFRRINYTVIRGDNLSRISERTGVTIETIRQANPDLGRRLKQGTVVSLPVRQSVIRVNVLKGDNLWMIGKAFGVKTDDLQRWNRIDPRAMKPGQTIVVRPRIFHQGE